MPDRILVTGGAGFVGSTTSFELKRVFPRADIVAFDNLRRRGSELNVPRLKTAGVRFVHGDVRHASDLEQVPADMIVECSAEPSALAGYGSPPDYTVETNLFGCYNCLNLARRTKADFLFLSTSRVYPVEALNSLSFQETDTRFEWLDEQTIPGASRRGIAEHFPMAGVRSIYGATKLAAELMIQEFADAYGFRYAINRCGLIAGPWQMGKADQGVVTFWLAAHHFERPLRYIGFGGKGKQVRDILHVDDLAELIGMQAGCMKQFDRQVLNVGGGLEFSLSLYELTSLCEELTGKKITIGSEATERRADLRVYVTDNRKIEENSKWKPARNPGMVLRDISNWIRSNESQVVDALFGAPA
jgi:CDP-paratose 2-epimerase